VGRRRVQLGDFALQVDRQRQEDRPRGRHERGLHGAAKGRRQILDAIDLGGPLGPGPGDLDHVGIENRLFELQPPVLLAGGDQQRRARSVGVVEHAHRVAQPATDVQIDDARRARGLGIAVGHGHHRHFLQAEDVLDAAVIDQGVHQGQFGRAGIAEEVSHAGLGQHVQKGLDAADRHTQ
jgi:hypothetical protein